MASAKVKCNACGSPCDETILNKSICDFPDAPPLPKDVTMKQFFAGSTPGTVSNLLPFKRCKPSELQDGDVFIIPAIWRWQSYGVVSSIKGKKVICFASHDGHPMTDKGALFSMKEGCLQEVDLDKVLDLYHGDVAIVPQENGNRENTLENARAALGDSWSFFGNNSEHFATNSMSGKPKSLQIDNHVVIILKAVATCTVTTIVNQVFMHCAKCISKEVVKRVNIYIHASTRILVSEAAKEMTETATKSVALRAIKVTVKETTEEVVETTALSAYKKFSCGAKAGLIGGAAIEGVFLVGTWYFSSEDVKQGNKSPKEHQQHMVKCSGGACGSVAGGAVGAAVGTAILPGVGTFIGNILGSVAGNYLGSKCSEELFL